MKKPLKFTIFLLIFIPIFIKLYKNSNENGNKRFLTSLKVAAIIAFAFTRNDVSKADAIENNLIEDFSQKQEIVFTKAPNDASGLFPSGLSQTPSTQLVKKPSSFPAGGSKKPAKPIVTPKPLQRIPPQTSGQNQQGNHGGFTKNENGPGKPDPDKGSSSTTYESNKKVKLDKKKSQNYDYESYSYNKQSKKQEQCSIEPVQEAFRESKRSRKLAEKALKNPEVNREYIYILEQLENGVNIRDVGRRTSRVGKNIHYVRGYHGRYVIKQVGDKGVIEILGVNSRSNTNDMRKFANLMNNLYDTNINPNAY